jgi:hypothetical protein
MRYGTIATNPIERAVLAQGVGMQAATKPVG